MLNNRLCHYRFIAELNWWVFSVVLKEGECVTVSKVMRERVPEEGGGDDREGSISPGPVLVSEFWYWQI